MGCLERQGLAGKRLSSPRSATRRRRSQAGHGMAVPPL